MNQTATFKFTVGRLLCGEVRQFFAEAKFFGREFEYFESKGWFSRDFTVRGDTKDVRAIAIQIQRWAKANDLEKEE